MKLKYKFATYIFVFGGLFLLAVSALYFIQTRRGDMQSQGAIFQKTAEERAEHIAITLKEKARTAVVLSQSPLVVSALEASNAAFAAMDEEKRGAEIKRLDELWMRAADENDPVVRPVMTSPVTEFFKEHERAFPGEYGEIFLTNKYGVTISATKKLTTLAHAHKYWWKAAYNNGAGRVFFDDRGYDMSAKGYVIGATVPVVKDGAIIGILKLNQDITGTLKKVIDSWRPGRTGKLVIARAKGKIVLAPGPKPMESDAPAIFVEKMKGRVSGFIIIDEGGVRTLAAYAPLKISNGEGEYGFGGTSDSIDHLLGNRGEIWFVIISQSLQEATAESFERAKEAGLIGLALIGLMGVGAFYFGGRLAAPVTRMEEAARKIGAGDYDVHAVTAPKDEMGDLVSAFNQMAVNLKTTTISRDRLMEEVESRKSAEEKLRESEERFRRFAEAAFEGIAVTEKGRFLDVNRRLVEMLGYENANEIIGKNVLDMTAPAYRDIVAANIAAGYEKPYEIFGIRKDGSLIPIEVRGKMMNLEGRMIRIAALRDLRERKEAEKALFESESKYRALVEETSDWVWELDENGLFTYSSPQVREITGYGAEEILGKTPFDFMRPEEAGRVVEFFHATAATQKPFKSFENTTLHKDGHEVVIETSGTPRFGADGKFIGYRGINRDITERVKAEQALRESEARFRLLFNSGGDAILVHYALEHGPGKIIEVNDITCQRLGYSREELLNMTPIDFNDTSLPNYAEDMGRIVAELKSGHEATFERVHITKDGRPIPVEIKARQFMFKGEPTVLSIVRDITERKRLEKKIRENNEILERIFETTHFHVVLLDTKFNFIRVNKAYADAIGFPPEYFVGKNHFALYPSEEAESKFRSVVETGIPYTVYARPFTYPDKPERGVTYWDLAVYPVKGMSGEVEGLLFTLLEVTERKRAEEAILENQKSLDSINEVLLRAGTDHEKNINNLTALAGQLLGGVCALYNRLETGMLCSAGKWNTPPDYNPVDRPDGHICYDVIRQASDKPYIVHDLQNTPYAKTDPNVVLYGLQTYIGEAVKCGKDYVGSLCVVYQKDFIPREEHKKFLGILASAIGVEEERKQAEEALATSEKKLRDITSVLGQGVYALDREGRLTFMNPAAERLLGWTEAELLGRDVHKLIHGKREDGSLITKRECPAHAAIHTGRLQTADGELLSRKDGGLFPANIIATPIIEDGKVAGAVVAFSDITERKRIMRELTEAKNLAEDATKLKGKFVSLVAHDLKSPLASMLGLMETIGEDTARPLDERHMDIMTHIMQSGQRMMSMINDLLDISRLQTGKIAPQPRFFDGFMAVEIAVSGVIRQAANKGVRIVTDVPPGTRLYGDMNLFGEVLTNLLTNAVKFSHRDGVVTVFSPGEGVVAVRDTGVGVSKTVLPFIFRHEEKTTTPGTVGELGTGLGLPLSHDIMTAMGGDLTVESEEGRGSVFHARFPLVRPMALVVDDEPPVRLLIRRHLARVGVDVMEAGDAKTALSMAERERPHIILTDISMPGMSGFELLSALRKNPATAAIPVIMITADSQMETREKAFRAGADDFLNKPLLEADFMPRVRRFVG